MAVCDHTVMQVYNDPATLLFEQERENGMGKTAKSAAEHLHCEVCGRIQMLKIGFPDSFRVLCEQSVHGVSV